MTSIYPEQDESLPGEEPQEEGNIFDWEDVIFAEEEQVINALEPEVP